MNNLIPSFGLGLPELLNSLSDQALEPGPKSSDASNSDTVRTAFGVAHLAQGSKNFALGRCVVQVPGRLSLWGQQVVESMLCGSVKGSLPTFSTKVVAVSSPKGCEPSKLLPFMWTPKARR